MIHFMSLGRVVSELCYKLKGQFYKGVIGKDHLSNLEKTDPSEIERTYNIRKQQTRLLSLVFGMTNRNGPCYK